MKTLIEKILELGQTWADACTNNEMSIVPDNAFECLDDVIDIVKQHSDWVSVNERLPEPDTTILVYENFWKKNTRIITARLIEGEFLAYPGWHKTVNVAYWCEIPQPPSEVQA